MRRTWPSTDRAQIHAAVARGSATDWAAVDPGGQSAEAVNGIGESALWGVFVGRAATGGWAMRLGSAAPAGAGSRAVRAAAPAVAAVATSATAPKTAATQGVKRSGVGAVGGGGGDADAPQPVQVVGLGVHGRVLPRLVPVARGVVADRVGAFIEPLQTLMDGRLRFKP